MDTVQTIMLIGPKWKRKSDRCNKPGNVAGQKVDVRERIERMYTMYVCMCVFTYKSDAFNSIAAIKQIYPSNNKGPSPKGINQLCIVTLDAIVLRRGRKDGHIHTPIHVEVLFDKKAQVKDKDIVNNKG